MSFIEDFLFGIADNQAINDLKQKRYQRSQEREKNEKKDSGRTFV